MMRVDILLNLDRSSSTALRDQICEQISALIARGQLKPDQRLPSCRRLSKLLGVAKNTVIAAYQILLQDEHIIAREKSGFYVARSSNRGFVPAGIVAPIGRVGVFDRYPLATIPLAGTVIERPDEWIKFPYVFVCNQLDRDEFPLSTWRRCGHDALSRSLTSVSTSDHMYGDYDVLVQQIRTRLLPRRGIHADPGNILLVAGAQQAIFISAMLLARSGRRIGIEDPGYPDARNMFLQLFGDVALAPVDEEGIVLDALPTDVSALYLNPSEHFPLGFAMSARRRALLLDWAAARDVVVLEDDYDALIDLSPRPFPALKSYASHANIVYVGSLSKSIAPGLRLGFMVGPPEFIREARAWRGMMMRHTPPLIQIMASQFIRLGHFDARIEKLKNLYATRLDVLDRALLAHLPSARRRPGATGSSIVLQLPGYDVEGIEKDALNRGIVIDALWPCYAGRRPPPGLLRLGVSAIATGRIEAGIRVLAELLEARRSRAA